jgi:hypothetical protein
MNERKKAILDILRKDSNKASKFVDLLVNLVFQKLNTDRYVFDGKTVCNSDNTVLVCYVSDIEKITIPDHVNIIGVMALKNHHKLVHLTIPSSVKTIEEEAVSHCDSLQVLHIPSSVTTVKSDAFCVDKSLTKVVFEGVPEHISRHAFDCCHALQQIEVPMGSTEFFRKELHIDEKSKIKIIEPSVSD